MRKTSDVRNQNWVFYVFTVWLQNRLINVQSTISRQSWYIFKVSNIIKIMIEFVFLRQIVLLYTTVTFRPGSSGLLRVVSGSKCRVQQIKTTCWEKRNCIFEQSTKPATISVNTLEVIFDAWSFWHFEELQVPVLVAEWRAGRVRGYQVCMWSMSYVVSGVLLMVEFKYMEAEQ